MRGLRIVHNRARTPPQQSSLLSSSPLDSIPEQRLRREQSQDTLFSAYSDAPTLVDPPRHVVGMAEQAPAIRERRVSYGIGGAGNIREYRFLVFVYVT